MRIFRHYAELPADCRGGVVALGNFDGVHVGHQRVIGIARAIARELGAPFGVMTFEPHPRSLFNRDKPAFRLTPYRIKARLIESLGAGFLFQQHFDAAFAGLSAEDFAGKVLVEGLGVVHVVMGYDYVFGHRRQGDCAVMQALASRFGFGQTSVAPVRGPGGVVYSSTAIRQALVAGDPGQAARLLGHCFEVEGRVEQGDHRGRQLGFATANLKLAEYQHPATGVYAIRAGIDKGPDTVWHDGVANFGNRPTFDKADVLLETHLFDFDGDLYGQHLRVALIDYLRPERKFDGIDALKAQIAEDCAAARRILAQRRFPCAPAPMVSIGRPG